MTQFKVRGKHLSYHALSVLVVDQNERFCSIVSRFLSSRQDSRVCDVWITSAESHALAQARALHPEVVLVNMDPRDCAGLVLIQQFRHLLPEATIIATTLHSSSILGACRELASSYGADEVLARECLITDLFPAIQANRRALSRIGVRT